VYTLEKVLKMKTDTVSGINFLDEAMKVINNNNNFATPCFDDNDIIAIALGE